MIAVDRDPALNIKLVSDPPQGPAQIAEQGRIKLQTAPGKTPGEIPVGAPRTQR